MFLVRSHQVTTWGLDSACFNPVKERVILNLDSPAGKADPLKVVRSGELLTTHHSPLTTHHFLTDPFESEQRGPRETRQSELPGSPDAPPPPAGSRRRHCAATAGPAPTSR